MTTVSAQPILDTVDLVHARIRQAIQIPVQRQQLLFEGQELQCDGRTLAEHGVQADSTLQLVEYAEGRAVNTCVLVTHTAADSELTYMFITSQSMCLTVLT